MEIVYSRAAHDDLKSLLEFIVSENPKNAELVLNRIEDHIKLLSTQPEIGRPGRVPETRELIVPNTPFIVPYQIRDATLVILRVYHAARKWPKSF